MTHWGLKSSKARSTSAGSAIVPSTMRTAEIEGRAARCPVAKSSMTRISCPAGARRSTRFAPRQPAPPVIRMRTAYRSFLLDVLQMCIAALHTVLAVVVDRPSAKVRERRETHGAEVLERTRGVEQDRRRVAG